MAATDWIGGSGDWGDASNWSAGVPDEELVQANLGGTSAYTATIGANESFDVGFLNITDANAILSLNSDLKAFGTIDLEAGTLAVGARGVLHGTPSHSTFVNHGTVTAETTGGVFVTDGIAFTNAGTFDIGNSNTAYIQGPFTNTGTVNVTVGSRLVLQGGGTTADLGSIVNSGQIWLYNTLDNSNAVLRVGSGNPLGSVQLNGTIKGGTIVDGGSGLIADGGALDGVTYEGTLTLEGEFLAVVDGLNFTGATGTGAGALLIDGNAGVYFYGTQTIDNATVTLGSSSAPGGFNVSSDAAAGILTLGANLTLGVDGNGSLVGGDGTLVNRGRIVAETADGFAYMAPGAITNSGAIIVANGQGAVLQVVAPLANDGAAEVISGILDLRGAVTGTGSIQIDRSGVLQVEQAIGAGQRIAFYRTGGALEIGDSSGFQAVIDGFGSGKFLDLRDVAFGSGTSVNFTANAGGGTLTVSDGTHTAALKLTGDFSGGTFGDKADDIGGTIVFFNDAANAAAQSRLHQFNAAVATHSAGASGSAAIHPQTADAAASPLLAAAHH